MYFKGYPVYFFLEILPLAYWDQWNIIQILVFIQILVKDKFFGGVFIRFL